MLLRCFAAAALLVVLKVTINHSQEIITTDPNCKDAADCDPYECRCASTDAPGELNVSEIPQMILLSFDDAMLLDLYNNFYMKLFKDKVNPNGCPIRGTFFIQHDYTNYSLVHELWRNGYEIASHSMTHRVPAEDWEAMTLEEITEEMVGIRTSAAQFARIPAEDIVGVRVPYLRMCGNTYTEMMSANGFLYDASRPTRQQMDPGLWPYTYDFVYNENLFLDCPIPECPGAEGMTFPGIWQIPINDLNDTKGTECAMLDQCNNRPENYEEAIELLQTNFEAHYNGNRSPFNLFTHASWFQGDWTHNFDALSDWLDEILTMYTDVYVIPVGKLIEYMRSPVSIENVPFSLAFDCSAYYPDPIQERDCLTVNNCAYCEPEEVAAAEGRAPTEVIMPVCGRCPPCWPTPKDPLGETCGGEPVLNECPPRS